MTYIDGRYQPRRELPWRFGAIVVAEERSTLGEVLLARVDESVFEHEAERDEFVAAMDAALAVKHANVMYLDRVFVSGGAVWIVGDEMKGTRLGEVIDSARAGGRAVRLEDVRRWLAQLSSGLSQLQDRGVIGVDLDEDSVWVTRDGARIVFPGVANALGRRALLARAAQVGRLEALAPEVRAGDKLDLRGDVYSFGRFAGVLLSTAKVARADVATVLLRAQDPDPHARYASSERFRQELEAVLTSPSTEGDPVTPAMGVEVPKEAWHTSPTKPVDPEVLRRLQDQEVTREVPRAEIVPLIAQSSTTEQIDADMIVPPEPGEAGRDELHLETPVPRAPDPETVPGKRPPEPETTEVDAAADDVLPPRDLPPVPTVVDKVLEAEPEVDNVDQDPETKTTPMPPAEEHATPTATPTPVSAPPPALIAATMQPPSKPLDPVTTPAPAKTPSPPRRTTPALVMPPKQPSPRAGGATPAASPPSRSVPSGAMWVWFVVVALVVGTGTALYLLHVYNQQRALVEHEQKRQMAEELKAQAERARRQKAPPSEP